MDTAQRRIQAVTESLKPTASWTHLLRLPDDHEVHVSTPLAGQKNTTPAEISIAGKVVCAYRALSRKAVLVLSAVGTKHERTADHVPRFPILEISSPSPTLAVADLWAIIYTLFELLHQETIPVILASAIENKEDLRSYILLSGLGRTDHVVGSDKKELGEELYLLRGSFWQGAGTSNWHARGFTPPSTAFIPFPAVQSFTRTPNVITAHPLRPPKPVPGSVMYRRWIPKVGQMLEFVAMDVGDLDLESVSPDLALFSKWHNNPRVSSAWGEAGPICKHQEYLKGIVADPSVIPVIMKWDGEAFGYSEFVYIKENHVAQYIPGGAEDYDRGMHVLQGEEKFKGFVRSVQWFTSINHYLFLADPRTNRVCGEPRSDNGAIRKVWEASGMHVALTFDFPYKRSNLVVSDKQRFFQLDLL